MNALVILALVTKTWTVPTFLTDTTECGPPSPVPLRDASRCALIGWQRWAAAPETLAWVDVRGREGQKVSATFDDRGAQWTLWAITLRDGGPPSCHGNGVTLNTPTTGVPGGPYPLSLGPVIPSPSRARATVQFSLPVSGPAELELYDLGGRRIATLLRATLVAGPHLSLFDCSRLAQGLYTLRLRAADRTTMLRFVVIR